MKRNISALQLRGMLDSLVLALVCASLRLFPAPIEAHRASRTAALDMMRTWSPLHAAVHPQSLDLKR